MMKSNQIPYTKEIKAFNSNSRCYYSYIASPIAFKTLSKKEFSALQTKVFPHFFLAQSVSPIIIGLTAPYALTTGALITLGTAIIGGLTNYAYLLPETRKIKEARFKLEDEGKSDSAEFKELSKQFGKIHGFSLLFNLVNFTALTTYGFILVKNIVRYAPK
ncbi:putative membrane protein [Wickerhamomyces ciferrii]|uniref:Membrane protein n=1 Tax=Wickerhamomyces ciferrii (strain ATCC 14091 / BCRC 22168 / CBS 111 / JCM 3599 / NBRC 0793 / NRRL Y-1031 F-60-10) TaxID=1206466 RepID=K0KQM5_WICCF|nr:uncharacterized protein BN7_4938 [Wickerhamomyces ciferrii]CCH45356.1 putative membrane protein [Wickerhamomyces ciferrii]